MAKFIGFGKAVINVEQVCSVCRVNDTSVAVRMSNFSHFEPRPGDTSGVRLGQTTACNYGEHIFTGEEAKAVWDFFQNQTQS